MNWCLFIPLITTLLGAFFGYLLGKSAISSWKNKVSKLETDLSACNKSKIGLESELKVAKATSSKDSSSTASNDADLKAKITKLEDDLSSERIKNTALQNEVNLLKNRGNTPAEISSSFASANVTDVPSFDATAAKTAFGKKIKQDDLTVVEGIGPKIQQLFHNHNVKTWLALSQCSVEKCQEVLDSGGSRFRMHKPNTWPKQAELAANGKWAELKKWQDELDGGN